MGKRIFLSLLICLICNVCYIYQVNADASSCTDKTGEENCKCPGWGYRTPAGCMQCDEGTYNDGTSTQCKTCPARSYCPAGSSNPTPCPTGSTSAEGAKAQTDCYMNSETRFCNGSGANCINFNTVFGDVTISYDATDE